jgi:hypothetical protein
LILLCVIIRRHYRLVTKKLRSLSDILEGLPAEESAAQPLMKL